MESQQTKVWDIFIRIFHWSLLTTFVISYLTEDDFPLIHVYAGYTMMVLITLRIVWGFIGTPYARFRCFVVKPNVVLNYIKDIVQFKAKRFLGHNPAGGLMVVALLITLSLTLFFGLLTYGSVEFSGPLANLASNVSSSTAHFFKEMHEFFANFTVLLIVLHIVGVLVASLQHKENLVKSMITGYKKNDKKTN